ncbi:MAG: ATP-binding protein, partial [Dehalococcoidia bacterium]
GKFGVGMKSSSLSQAKEVTLLSKVEGGKTNLRRLSSEVILETDRWTLIPNLRDHMDTEAISIAKAELASLTSGSAVVLEDMHKLKHRIGDSEHREEYLNAEYGHIRDYLGCAVPSLTGFSPGPGFVDLFPAHGVCGHNLFSYS